jgi:hypothetical protein
MRRSVLALGILIAPQVAAADGPEQHSGFMLRLHLGFAYTQFTTDDLGPELSVSGAGGTFGIAVGVRSRRT